MKYASFHCHISAGTAAAVNTSTILYPGTTFETVLMLEEEITSVTVNQIGGINNYISYNPTGDATAVGVYGLDNEIQIPAANAQNIGNVNGFYCAANHYGSGPAQSLNGVYGAAYNQGPALVTDLFGCYGDVAVNGAGNVTTARALYARVFNGGNGGVIATAYGLYIDTVQATTAYGVYQANAANENFFAGPIEEGGAKFVPARLVAGSGLISGTTDQKLLLNDNAAGANTLTLPAGAAGLTYQFGPTAANTGTWALAPTGGDVIDGAIPADIATVPNLSIVFVGGTWYRA